jgi:hypothetical protein
MGLCQLYPLPTLWEHMKINVTLSMSFLPVKEQFIQSLQKYFIEVLLCVSKYVRSYLFLFNANLGKNFFWPEEEELI